MSRTDLYLQMLWIAGAGLLAFFVACFLWGFFRPMVRELKVLRGDGPLDAEEARMAYGASLLIWRACLLLAFGAVALWYSIEFASGRVTAAISIVLLGVGWCVRSLGVRRMRRSMEAGGYGRRHLSS